jgi:hypothetical protein
MTKAERERWRIHAHQCAWLITDRVPLDAACLMPTPCSRHAATVEQVNTLLGVNLWGVRSFRADVRIDFDEYGHVLSASLLSPESRVVSPAEPDA